MPFSIKGQFVADPQKIFVTGATGGVGRHVVAELVERGHRVQALVHHPETADLPIGVEVIAGDLAEPESLADGLDGIDAVFLLWPFFSGAGASAVVDAIARRAQRIVYLSAEGAADDPESFWAAVEGEIRESGLSWTFLRPTGFAKNTLEWSDQVHGGLVRGPYGQAARSPIDERDVAAVAVRALTEDGHAGATYVLTGPETVTQAEQVLLIGEAIGQPVVWQEQSREEARPGLVALFGDEAFADNALDSWAGLIDEPERVRSHWLPGSVDPGS